MDLRLSSSSVCPLLKDLSWYGDDVYGEDRPSPKSPKKKDAAYHADSPKPKKQSIAQQKAEDAKNRLKEQRRCA